ERRHDVLHEATAIEASLGSLAAVAVPLAQLGLGECDDGTPESVRRVAVGLERLGFLRTDGGRHAQRRARRDDERTAGGAGERSEAHPWHCVSLGRSKCGVNVTPIDALSGGRGHIVEVGLAMPGSLSPCQASPPSRSAQLAQPEQLVTLQAEPPTRMVETICQSGAGIL